ncbi:hypothetical protein TWF751_000130 [Orbilia oligospora]|nr:hypothetical protein TWF751_000130 [Orbilia oligospora]
MHALSIYNLRLKLNGSILKYSDCDTYFITHNGSQHLMNMIRTYLFFISLFCISIYPLSAYLINFQRHRAPQTLEGIDRKYFSKEAADQSCTLIPGNQTQELSTIRIRGDPTIGSPPHALAFFTGTECNDTTVSVITRFFQISDRVEQSISPFAVRGSLTEGPEWDRNLIAPTLYNYYESVGYTSTLWGAIVDLELEPGDMAFKYVSLDGSVNEWRVATAVIAMEEEPDVVGADSMLPLAYFARKLSISLPEMAEDERKLTSAHFQKIAEERPAEEKVLIVENPALIDPESVWRNRLVHDHERKIKIGKLARAANNYGPAPIRKNNPSMIELNPLVNLVGQSNLEDIERKRELTVEEYLNDRDWDLYLPESKLKV